MTKAKLAFKEIKWYQKAINNSKSYSKAVDLWLDLSLNFCYHKRFLSDKMYQFLVKRIDAIKPM